MEGSSLSPFRRQESYPEGVIVKNLEIKPNGRGCLSELLRVDWKDIVKDEIKQILLSISNPGEVRGWHRHTKGQIDYSVVIEGKVEMAIQENVDSPITKIELDGGSPKLVRIPGRYWHATKNVGYNFSITLYFLSEVYDYENPDSESREVKEW